MISRRITLSLGATCSNCSRNTFRWLLGNLNGFDAATGAVPDDQLPELEQYILHRLYSVMTTVKKHYDEFQYHKAYKVLYEFCGGDLSNFYFDARKDVLYCDPASSPVRRACLTVLERIFKTLVTHVAPILVFTCDEAWRSRYGQDESVHMQVFADVVPAWKKPVSFESRWSWLLAQRAAMNTQAEACRKDGSVGANADLMATILLGEDAPIGVDDAALVSLVTGFSHTVIQQGDERHTAHAVIKHPGHKCPRCWRHYDKLEADGVCTRCEGALKEAAV